jgi:hypothetical protein
MAEQTHDIATTRTVHRGTLTRLPALIPPVRPSFLRVARYSLGVALS